MASAAEARAKVGLLLMRLARLNRVAIGRHVKRWLVEGASQARRRGSLLKVLLLLLPKGAAGSTCAAIERTSLVHRRRRAASAVGNRTRYRRCVNCCCCRYLKWERRRLACEEKGECKAWLQIAAQAGRAVQPKQRWSAAGRASSS